jgi:hypothetical protein
MAVNSKVMEDLERKLDGATQVLIATYHPLTNTTQIYCMDPDSGLLTHDELKGRQKFLRSVMTLLAGYRNQIGYFPKSVKNQG